MDAGPVLVIATSASVSMASWSVAIAEVRLASPAGGSTCGRVDEVAGGRGIDRAGGGEDDARAHRHGHGRVDVAAARRPGTCRRPCAGTVHVTPVSVAGNVSVTVAPIASLGPSGLVTVMV